MSVEAESAVMICDDDIIEALYGWVAYNPHTGNLRLAKCTNLVWLAVEKLGGVKATAKLLGYPQQEIHRWIDEHFIPHGIVEEVAQLTLYSIPDLQVPSMWMGSDGIYWPPSGYLAERAEETEAHNKRAPQKHGKDARVNQAYRAAIVKARARTVKQEQTNIQWEMLVESARTQTIPPAEDFEYMEGFQDDPEDREGGFLDMGPLAPSEPQCHVHRQEQAVEGACSWFYIGNQEDCPFCREELGLREVDTQLIPEGNAEIEKYGKNL
jgi:hypothetical protein